MGLKYSRSNQDLDKDDPRPVRVEVRGCDEITEHLCTRVARAREAGRLARVTVDCRRHFDQTALDRLCEAAGGANKLVLVA